MSTIAQSQLNTLNPIAGYVAVKVELLRRLDEVGVDIFVEYDRHAEPVLYHRAGCPIESNQFSALEEGGVRQVLVRGTDLPQFGKELLESVQKQSQRESVSQAERFAALQLAMAVEIERTAHMLDCGPYVKLAGRVAAELTAIIAGNTVLPRELFRLARHDFSTFAHVTNVACYTIILAERLGIRNKELQLIAAGAVLHDLGKRYVPAALLVKPASLAPAERALVETHPQRGFEELCRRKGIVFDQLMMVYQHHERIDGRGYPVGVTGDEIHPWAQILAVVDVFDAMTGARPYRRRVSVEEALTFIQKYAGSHFAPEVVECWRSAMTA